MEPLRIIAAEFRAGFRSQLRRPLSTAFAVLVLGLGIGLTTTLFSIVDGVLLSGLPFPESDQLVTLYRSKASVPNPFKVATLHDFNDWRDRQRAFSDLAAFQASFVFLSTDTGTEGFVAAYVTDNLFGLLGVRPLLGSGFPSDDRASEAGPPAILSYDLWQRRFGGRPDVLGRKIRINKQVTTCVGVMPEGFRFPYRQDVWLPLRMDADRFSRQQSPSVFVVGRIRPGLDVRAAQAEMTAISSRLAGEFPDTDEGVVATVEPFVDALTDDKLRSSLLLMLGGVVAVLFIACISVANLLLARTARRRGELALRTALGATRWRVSLQILAETLLITLAAALLGVLLAILGVSLFNRYTEMGDYLRAFWVDVQVDVVALGFTFAVAAVSTLAAGLAPALMAAKLRSSELLGDVSRSKSRRLGALSRSIVVVEVALSLGLLVGAGLTIQTVAGLARFDYGFDKDSVLVARLSLYPAEYSDDQTKSDAFGRILEILVAEEGLSATLASAPPSETPPPRELIVEGRPAEAGLSQTALPVVAGPGFFDTLGIPLLSGRDFSIRDAPGTAPVAVVSHSFAQRYLGSDEATGYRFRWADDPEGAWIRIVGLAADATFGILGEDADQPVVYERLGRPTPNSMYLLVANRAGTPPLPLAGTVRRSVREVDPRIALYEVQSLVQLLARESWLHRLFAVLFGIVGITALLLAVLGLYGVISFNAQARAHEFGIRSALGARGSSLRRLALREGLIQLGAGLALGLLLAFWTTRSLASVLPGVAANDPLITALVIAILMAAGLLACYLPAQRASKVDPTTLLKR